MEKKKRGRKPKNNIVLNENPVFDNLQDGNNLIACIKKNTNKKEIIINDKIEGIETNNNIYFLNNDKDIDKDIEEDKETIKHCWNCCYSIEGNIISYPVHYTNNIFYTNGNFCSYECAARYIFDNFNHK